MHVLRADFSFIGSTFEERGWSEWKMMLYPKTDDYKKHSRNEKKILNKILNWALCVEYIYVVTFYVWCVWRDTNEQGKK